jgi:hypothetical protein
MICQCGVWLVKYWVSIYINIRRYYLIFIVPIPMFLFLHYFTYHSLYLFFHSNLTFLSYSYSYTHKYKYTENKDTTKGIEKHIFTHRTLSISYNNDQIIEVNLTSENPVPIQENINMQFTYTVKWIKTEKLFDGRFDRYLEDDFFEHKVCDFDFDFDFNSEHSSSFHVLLFVFLHLLTNILFSHLHLPLHLHLHLYLHLHLHLHLHLL